MYTLVPSVPTMRSPPGVTASSRACGTFAMTVTVKPRATVTPGEEEAADETAPAPAQRSIAATAERNRMSTVYRFQAALFDLFGTLVDGRGNACPGAAEALRTVETLPWAVVTSCTRELATLLLRRADHPQPPVLVGAEDVARQKPAPDGYLLAARLMKMPPEACVVFEDSASGLAAARAAGMHGVSVLCGWQRVKLAVENGELSVIERAAP